MFDDVFTDSSTDTYCDSCFESISIGVEACMWCGIVMDYDFWADKYADLELKPVEYNTLNSLSIIDHFSRSTLLCCDQSWDNCVCDVESSADWNDVVGSLTQPQYEAIYTMDTECSSCYHWYRHSCPVMRSWLRDYLEDNTLDASIDDVCEYYLDWQSGEDYVNAKSLMNILEEQETFNV